jgi:hypothetical protein
MAFTDFIKKLVPKVGKKKKWKQNKKSKQKKCLCIMSKRGRRQKMDGPELAHKMFKICKKNG